MKYIPSTRIIINAIIYTFAAFGFTVFIVFILLYTIFDIRKTYVFDSVEALINRTTLPLILPYSLDISDFESVKVDTDIALIGTKMTYTMPSNALLESKYTDGMYKDMYGNSHIISINSSNNTLTTELIKE